MGLAIEGTSAAVGESLFAGIMVPAEIRGAAAIRRWQFLAGRFCASRALAHLDSRSSTQAVGRCRDGAPVWPSGIVGSITHTDGFVAAAVARREDARGLGIDSEGIVSSERARRIACHVSWPSELAHGRQAGLDRAQSMTLVFSAKESIFKCLYPLIGRMFYYHDVRIVDVDAATRTFRARIVTALSDEFAAGSLIDGRFEMSGSLAHTGMWLPLS